MTSDGTGPGHAIVGGFGHLGNRIAAQLIARGLADREDDCFVWREPNVERITGAEVSPVEPCLGIDADSG
jgi:hypothetical protein